MNTKIIFILIIFSFIKVHLSFIDNDWYIRRIQEREEYDKIVSAAPKYIRNIIKEVSFYPRTSFIIKQNGYSYDIPKISYCYNGTFDDFSIAVSNVSNDVELFANGSRDLSIVILSELKNNFDDYLIDRVDSIIISQRFGSEIGIGKMEICDNIDWLSFKGRSFLIPYNEVKNAISEKINKPVSLFVLIKNTILFVFTYSLPWIFVFIFFINCCR